MTTAIYSRYWFPQINIVV